MDQMVKNSKEAAESIGQNKHRVVANVIVEGNNFEPGVELKNLWLNTRKNKVRFGNVELYGMFSTYGFGLDRFCFFLIIALEGWGLYNLNLLIDNVVLSSLLFFCDALFAIGSHYWSNDLILARNRLSMAKFDIIYLKGKSPNNEKEIEESNISKFKALSLIFQLLIIGLAGFKIFSFLGNNTPDTPFALSFTIILTYLLVAYLHIRSTGYFLSGLIREIRYKAQYNKNLLSQTPTEFTVQNHREFDLNLQIEQNHAELVKLANIYGYTAPDQPRVDFVNVMTKQHYLYNNKLYTWGVLEDRDLQNLISVQPTNKQKEFLAMYGLKHQFEILNAPAAANAGILMPFIDPNAINIQN
jgi:hypothetical protein